MKMQNVAQGLIIFILLTSLVTGIYKSFEDNYGVEDSYYGVELGNNNTITAKLMSFNKDINDDINSFTSGIGKLVAPTSGFDILGGLALVSIGFFKTLWNFFTIPARILDIVVIFYPFPKAIINFITALFLLAFVFILARLYTKEEL